MTAVERAELVGALECVDYVVIFSDSRLDRLLEMIRPAVHAKGTDYSAETVPERETVLRHGGKVAIVGSPKSWSSSALIRRVLERCAGPHASPHSGER